MGRRHPRRMGPYLRPKLARDFLAATRQKEPAAVAAAGRLLFGEDLWQWVDPQNVSPARRNEPGRAGPP